MRRLRIALALAGFALFGWGCTRALDIAHVRFSAAVLGMALLLGAFMLRRRIDPAVDRGAHVLLRYLPLFFVPSSVGAMQYGALLRHSWLGIALALVASTIAGIWAAASVGTFVAERAR